MRIPYNRYEQIMVDIMSVVLLVLVVYTIAIRQRSAAAGQNEVTDVILLLIALADLICLLILRTTDYWIDETGVYTRILFGKVTVRKLPRERICFFGVVPVATMRGRIQIMFSDKMPKHPVEGYSERWRGMIHFDYTPERYAAICSIFTPPPHAVVIRPEDGLSS